MIERVVAWSDPAAERFEYSSTCEQLGSISARGTILNGQDEPYRVDYQLDTGPGFVTTRLSVHASGQGWSRTLLLRRDEDGAWILRRGREPFDAATVQVDARFLTGADDVDLGFSAVTVATPVLRHHLHRRLGRQTVAVASVSLPELTVRLQEQTFTHLRTGTVRQNSGIFTADITFADDGFPLHYPGVASRVGGAGARAASA